MSRLRFVWRLLVFACLAALAPAQTLPNYVVSTIAGVFPVGDGGPALDALLEMPSAVVVDAKGNLYIADSGNGEIRKVSPGGIITKLEGYSGYARCLALDSAGNLYIGEIAVVRRLSPDGKLTVFAGTGSWGNTGDGGLAVNAQLGYASSLAVDGSDNVYVLDGSYDRVRKVAKDGIIQAYAGNGKYGYSADKTPALSAALEYAHSIAVDPTGNLYIAEWYRVRRVGPDGLLTTFAGTGSCCDPGNAIPTLATSASINIAAVAADQQGNILISTGSQIKQVGAAGILRTIAGTGAGRNSGDGGLATVAGISQSGGFAAAADGTIYFINGDYETVRAISPGGIISTVAGKLHFAGDGGPTTAALLHRPQGAVTGPDGTIYFSDTVNHRIRRLTPDGKISTYAGTGEPGYSGDGGSALSAKLSYPSALALDADGNLFVVDQSGYRIRRIDASGTIKLVAGVGYWSETPPQWGSDATIASFPGIGDIATDSAGNLFLAVGPFNKVYKVTRSGAYSTFAGTGSQGYFGDGGQATAALMYNPSKLAFDNEGSLLVYESGNYRIRKITSSGVISTIAGRGSCCADGDGGPALNARINVGSMLVDKANNIWLSNSCAIRVINPAGVINTVAGRLNYCGFAGDGGPATAALFGYYSGIAANTDGSMVIVDTNNNRIRKLELNPPARLEIVSGNNQDAIAGTALKAPLLVRLMLKLGGGAPGVEVAYAITSGEGKLTATKTVTDPSGQAAVGLTPTKAGSLTVTATAAGFSVTFTFTVKEPPPVINPDTPKILSGGIVGNRYSTPLIHDISTGAAVDIWGEHFAAPGTMAVAPQGAKLPTKLGGVCVTVGGQLAPLYFVAATQLAIQVPKVAAAAQVPVQVLRYCGEATELKSNVENVAAKTATPELVYLQNNLDGRNPVAGQTLDGKYAGEPGSIPGIALKAVKSGDFLTFYGIGFGPVSPEVAPGDVATGIARLTLPIVITIGGVRVPDENITYAGVCPSYFGLYQLNIKLPPGLAPGKLPMTVTIDGNASPSGPFLHISQ